METVEKLTDWCRLYRCSTCNHILNPPPNYTNLRCEDYHSEFCKNCGECVGWWCGFDRGIKYKRTTHYVRIKRTYEVCRFLFFKTHKLINTEFVYRDKRYVDCGYCGKRLNQGKCKCCGANRKVGSRSKKW